LKKARRGSCRVYHVSTDYFHRIESTDGHSIFDHGKNGIRHIAVRENKKIIGMLSVRDFSAYYVRKFGKK
jgi:signal-transduction protein with cAMP-binding, CBS, and nucleotidyltransferase domain